VIKALNWDFFQDQSRFVCPPWTGGCSKVARLFGTGFGRAGTGPIEPVRPGPARPATRVFVRVGVRGRPEHRGRVTDELCMATQLSGNERSQFGLCGQLVLRGTPGEVYGRSCPATLHADPGMSGRGLAEGSAGVPAVGRNRGSR
jgi:hypothetical protein